MTVWIEFIWLRTEISGRLFGTWQLNFRYH